MVIKLDLKLLDFARSGKCPKCKKNVYPFDYICSECEPIDENLRKWVSKIINCKNKTSLEKLVNIMNSLKLDNRTSILLNEVCLYRLKDIIKEK